MLVWELIGAVIGAGFVSGREIETFFGQYGSWGFVGLCIAGSVLRLSQVLMPTTWKNRWPDRIWRIMLSLLLMTTGGAMLAGAGEICARVLPFRCAGLAGMAATLLLAWGLAMKTRAGLALVSRVLVAMIMLMLLRGFTLPFREGFTVSDHHWHKALLSGVGYGGFNAALQWPVLAASDISDRKKRNSGNLAAAITVCLILAGIFLLKRHPSLASGTMPFLLLMKQLGRTGYYTFSICLYLSVLSTLTACIRSSRGSLLMLSGIMLVSSAGFSGIVGRVYPMLGIICCIYLLLAKITNSISGSFLSQQDMI